MMVIAFHFASAIHKVMTIVILIMFPLLELKVTFTSLLQLFDFFLLAMSSE
jgi:hypothetical protein